MSKHNIFELALTSNNEDSRILDGFKLQRKNKHDRDANSKKISECKHLKGTKQIECNRPENTPAQLPLCQRPLALKLPLCCPIFFGIVLITGPSECRVTVNFELNWIYFILFAMAPYGVVSQLLALVQWRAWAHARVTLVHDCGHHDDDGTHQYYKSLRLTLSLRQIQFLGGPIHRRPSFQFKLNLNSGGPGPPGHQATGRSYRFTRADNLSMVTVTHTSILLNTTSILYILFHYYTNTTCILSILRAHVDDTVFDLIEPTFAWFDLYLIDLTCVWLI